MWEIKIDSCWVQFASLCAFYTLSQARIAPLSSFSMAIDFRKTPSSMDDGSDKQATTVSHQEESGMYMNKKRCGLD